MKTFPEKSGLVLINYLTFSLIFLKRWRFGNQVFNKFLYVRMAFLDDCHLLIKMVHNLCSFFNFNFNFFILYI